VAVHHLEAHCLIARIALAATVTPPGTSPSPDTDTDREDTEGSVPRGDALPHCRPKVHFPFLTFLASGGHTSLLLCRELGACSQLTLKFLLMCHCMLTH
jgi:hypothetical protein